MNGQIKKEPKMKKVIEGADSLSLGISIVVAVLLGVALGLWLKSIFDSVLLLWLGVFWGVSAAILNIYRAYKKELIEYEEIAKNPKYNISNQKKEQ
jgi:F0F1-type ATP synthase assembly protein I